MSCRHTQKLYLFVRLGMHRGTFLTSRSNAYVMGHMETDPSSFWYFVTLCSLRESGFQLSGDISLFSFSEESRYPGKN